MSPVARSKLKRHGLRKPDAQISPQASPNRSQTDCPEESHTPHYRLRHNREPRRSHFQTHRYVPFCRACSSALRMIGAGTARLFAVTDYPVQIAVRTKVNVAGVVYIAFFRPDRLIDGDENRRCGVGNIGIGADREACQCRLIISVGVDEEKAPVFDVVGIKCHTSNPALPSTATVKARISINGVGNRVPFFDNVNQSGLFSDKQAIITGMCNGCGMTIPSTINSKPICCNGGCGLMIKGRCTVSADSK